MEKYKLALIGSGFLNRIVAQAFKDNYLPEFELVGVYGRNIEATKKFSEEFCCKGCNSIEELMELQPDFTAEAASVEAIRKYAEIVLNSKSNLVVLSIGAFADNEFYEKIGKIAFENNRKVYIASGAVGGFDILRTATLMSPIEASIKSKKSAKSLKKTSLYKEGLMSISKPEEVFLGTTEEAIAVLPTQVNVAVATALASAGASKTKMKIDVVPDFIGDEYKIEIKGEEIYTDLNIYSRTSKVAAWSVVSVLQNAVSSIVF